MAKFKNKSGCIIRGDIESVEEINSERMGEGWEKVEEEQFFIFYPLVAGVRTHFIINHTRNKRERGSLNSLVFFLVIMYLNINILSQNAKKRNFRS